MKGPVKEISFPVFHQDRFFFIMEERGISSGGMFALCLEGEWLDPDRLPLVIQFNSRHSMQRSRFCGNCQSRSCERGYGK